MVTGTGTARTSHVIKIMASEDKSIYMKGSWSKLFIARKREFPETGGLVHL